MNRVKVYELVRSDTCEALLFFSKEKAFIELMKIASSRFSDVPYSSAFWMDKAFELDELGENQQVLSVANVGDIFVDEIIGE